MYNQRNFAKSCTAIFLRTQERKEELKFFNKNFSLKKGNNFLVR